jgi:hypothetical protein
MKVLKWDCNRHVCHIWPATLRFCCGLLYASFDLCLLAYISNYNNISFVHQWLISFPLKPWAIQNIQAPFNLGTIIFTRITYVSLKEINICSFCCMVWYTGNLPFSATQTEGMRADGFSRSSTRFLPFKDCEHKDISSLQKYQLRLTQGETVDMYREKWG